MPWGPRTPEDVAARALAVARSAAAHHPDALIVACNTASVHALSVLRAGLEPSLPVIGTVPAIKPAAAGGGPVAIWATPATTGSPYQRGLIRDFADAVAVTEVPCPGLAEAVEHADEAARRRRRRRGRRTSPRAMSGPSSWAAPTTSWSPSVSGRPRRSRPGLPPVVLHGSAGAVAAQALRRVGGASRPRRGGSRGRGRADPAAQRRRGQPGGPALTYPEGRLLAAG